VDRDSHAPFPSPRGISEQDNLGVPFIIIADLDQYGNVADPRKRYALRLAPDPDQATDVSAGSRHSPQGYFASELPDFLNDPHWREKLIDSGGTFDPRRRLLHFWDDAHDEWVAIVPCPLLCRRGDLWPAELVPLRPDAARLWTES
jgi:hypothetical protein